MPEGTNKPLDHVESSTPASDPSTTESVQDSQRRNISFPRPATERRTFEPVGAVWHTSSGPREVSIVGSYSDRGDEYYLLASGGGIAASEIELRAVSAEPMASDDLAETVTETVDYDATSQPAITSELESVGAADLEVIEAASPIPESDRTTTPTVQAPELKASEDQSVPEADEQSDSASDATDETGSELKLDLDAELKRIVSEGRELAETNNDRFYRQIQKITASLFANAEQRGLNSSQAASFVRDKLNEIKGPRAESATDRAPEESSDDSGHGLTPLFIEDTAIAESQPTVPLSPAAEHLSQTIGELRAAETRLLEVMIRRKARTGDGDGHWALLTSSQRQARSTDKIEFDRAMGEYKNSLTEYLEAKASEMRERGKNEAQILLVQTRKIYQAQRLLARDEVRLNDKMLDDIEHSADDKSFLVKLWAKPWAKRAVLIRKWADLSTKKKIAIGLTVGAGTALASGALGLGLAGLVAGTAARSSLGLINRSASLRNASMDNLHKRQSRINKDQSKALLKLHADLGSVDYNLAYGSHPFELVHRVEKAVNGEVQYAFRRNKLAVGVLALSGVSLVMGAAGLEGVLPNLHIPRPNFASSGLSQSTVEHAVVSNHGHHNIVGAHTGSIGTKHHVTSGHIPGAHGGIDRSSGHSIAHASSGGETHSIASTHLDFSNFHPDSFKAQNGDAAVWHAIGILQNNHMQVHGITNEKVRLINQALAKEHFHIASGVKANGQQNILNWPGGRTANAKASALQGFQKINGSSIANWEKFVKIAQEHGVRITQKS